MRRTLPDRDPVDIYWALHFALAMAHQTIRDTERLEKLSDGQCDVDDVAGVIARIVHVASEALQAANTSARVKAAASHARP